MEYFTVSDNKFIYNDSNLSNTYSIKNRTKCGTNIEKINTTENIELLFLKAIEDDNNVIYWKYKEVSIPYINPVTNKEEEYIPSYYVVRKDGIDSAKVFLYEIEKLHEMYIDNLTEEELEQLTDEELEEYICMKDQYRIVIEQFKMAKEYCSKNGMDFFVVSSEGIKRVFYDNNTSKYN